MPIQTYYFKSEIWPIKPITDPPLAPLFFRAHQSSKGPIKLILWPNANLMKPTPPAKLATPPRHFRICLAKGGRESARPSYDRPKLTLISRRKKIT